MNRCRGADRDVAVVDVVVVVVTYSAGGAKIYGVLDVVS